LEKENISLNKKLKLAKSKISKVKQELERLQKENAALQSRLPYNSANSYHRMNPQ